MSKTAVVILQEKQLDWYIRHSGRFVNALCERITSGETDHYPGYARWHGDGVPGMQVIWVGDHNINGVISAGAGCGVRLGVTHGPNKGSYDNRVDMLRELADSMGYVLRKKPSTSKKNAPTKKKTPSKKKGPRKKKFSNRNRY